MSFLSKLFPYGAANENLKAFCQKALFVDVRSSEEFEQGMLKSDQYSTAAYLPIYW